MEGIQEVFWHAQEHTSLKVHLGTLKVKDPAWFMSH